MKKSILKQWVAEQGISQETLAHEVGVTTGYMNKLMNRESSNIRINLLRKLSEVTGLAMEDIVDDLLQGEDEDENAA